jgi:hypothetical protein
MVIKYLFKETDKGSKKKAKSRAHNKGTKKEN